MKVYSMRCLKLILLCSLTAGSVLGTTPKLSSRSKNHIADAAYAGAGFGLLATAAGLAVRNFIKQTPPENHEIKQLAFGAMGLTAAGALIGAVWQYFYVPEKHFEYAKEKLSCISQDALIGALYQSKSEEWMNIVRSQFCRSRYPLMQAFSDLSAHYDTIVKVKYSLSNALTLDDAALRQEAQEMQEYANTTMMLLQAILGKITADANYTSECVAKAQEDSANSLKDIAVTETIRLANELTRPRVIYVADGRTN